MNTLMVLEHDYPEDERVTKEIQTLRQSGMNVFLACSTKENKAQYEKLDGLEIYRKPISKFIAKTSVGALKFPFYFNFWNSFIHRILKEKQIDAIHIHDLPLARVGYNICKKHNIKFVLDLHENWPVLLDLSPHTKSFLGKILSSKKQWLRYEKKYASLADGLVVVAEEMKQRLMNKGVINRNIAVVPNTSRAGIFEKSKNYSSDEKYITLYYAGGITQHRGLDIVIQGLSKMTLPDNFRFWIIGKGRNEPFLKKMALELNLSKKVFFLGWKTHSEVLELLLHSDIAVIPHLKNEHSDNTSPNKIFHYMLAKKPVLASNCKYIQNIVNETNCGLIYENDNPEDFIKKLKILIEDPSKREDLGNNGFHAAVNEYSWENTSKPLINLYKTLN
ncbi:glycosyltransferase WbuB [Mariniphaga sediminis]|jgi:glycosyltransferase involved in cell wall biosynthesis|uniref:Glycosyltransferase WbuB n=1 Tax=Mariniphaga sediminis TaxID=1628158 RepID=A0A399D1L5_9BACT|nr:glycosyltransferase family 4 protein [Mariniphaga sediminis]RIH64612.1 glycosyltransferase WbuB [Mariniphaga sediminis]